MEQKTILEGITEHDVVTVHNPLSTPFDAKVARSVVAPRHNINNQPTGNGAADAFMQGLQGGIARGGHQSISHVQQTITLKPGQTLRLPGDVALVVVRQLVKEMMQRQKAKKLMADPHMFMEYERKVVLNHESMLSNLNIETAQERLNRQLEELNSTPQATNEVAKDEQPFPTEQHNSTGGDTAASGVNAEGAGKIAAQARTAKK